MGWDVDALSTVPVCVHAVSPQYDPLILDGLNQLLINVFHILPHCGALIPQDAEEHAQEYTLRPINPHLYSVHIKHSMALYNVQGVGKRAPPPTLDGSLYILVCLPPL